jgi:RNA recognition motif-containing protein
VDRRVFVSNIPFEMKWQEVKDMFRDEVGEVSYVNMFNDEHDKPRGCGILEFGSVDLTKKAIDKMHKFDLKGRKLVVKEVGSTNNLRKRVPYDWIVSGY